MSFLQHNIVAFLVGLLACAYAWVWGGTRSAYVLFVIPWLWVLLLEGMFFFPQRRDGESSPQARERMRNELCRDPLAWTIAVFLVLLLIPFFNTALCPSCDARLLAAGVDPGPQVRFLPFCTNRYEHLNVFLWFAPVLTAVLAVRHSLGKSGRRFVIHLIVLGAMSLALFGYIEIWTGAKAPFWVKPLRYATDFFASFGYTNMAADYFMASTFLALALWRRRLDEYPEHHHHHGSRRGFGSAVAHLVVRHWLLLAAAFLFSATLFTLSRAGIILVTIGTGLLLVHAMMSYFTRLDRAGRVRASAFFLLAFALLSVFVMIFTPTDVRRELQTVGAVEALDRVAGRGEYHADVALALVKEHPFFGCGGWGYRHYSVPLLPEKVRSTLKYAYARGGANVHNDYLQFMVEHGVIGFALLVFSVVLLLEPTGTAWRRLARAARFAPRGQRPASPTSLFALPAPAFSILVAAGATLIHAFGDCPLRSPAVLSVFFIELAAIDGFLPEFDDADGNDTDEE